jgi:hypothetical protein
MEIAGDAIVRTIEEMDECSKHPAERFLAIPVVGPFLALAKGPVDGATRALLYADAGAQIAGLALVAIGIARHMRSPVRRAAQPQLQIITGVAGAPLGLSLIGSL